MRGFFVTGTDTDVGKTRISAALCRAWIRAGGTPTVVKLIQTGARGRAGDAETAGRLGGCDWRELEHFELPADPWSAAIAEGRDPLRAPALAERVRACDEPLICEGLGGAAVPLNATETITDVAILAGLDVVVVVGLRLGCVNHALLTLGYLRYRGARVAGVVCVERWQPTSSAYRADVTRVLSAHARVLGMLPFDSDADRSVATAVPLLSPIVQEKSSSTPQS